MADFPTRSQLLLTKIEGASGTPETPVVGTDAIKTEGVQWGHDTDVDTPNFDTGSLDGSEPIVGRSKGTLQVPFRLKGPGTAGAAPESGPCLRVCGLAETLLASDDTGTAQAGTASTMQLAAAAITSDDEFDGMVIEVTGGTGVGDPVRVITGSVASSDTVTVYPDFDTDPDATTVYKIRKSAVYIPASTSLETLTAYHYALNKAGGNVRLSQLVGAAGNLTLNLPVGGSAQAQVALQGILPGNPADVSAPSAATFNSTKAPVFKNAQVYLGGTAVKLSNYSLDLTAQVDMPDDPAAAEGYDFAGVMGRSVSGSIDPIMMLAATRDAFADFKAGTAKQFWLNYGATEGNRISIYHPAILYQQVNRGDVRGSQVEQSNFIDPSVDTGVYICFH